MKRLLHLDMEQGKIETGVIKSKITQDYARLRKLVNLSQLIRNLKQTLNHKEGVNRLPHFYNIEYPKNPTKRI